MQNWCHHWFLNEYSQQSKTRHSTRWFVIQVVTIIRSGSTSDESALQTITSRVVRQCDIASYHLLQVFGMIRSRRRQMSFEEQWNGDVPPRRQTWYAHHTHCSSTQPVACIRGYEPFVRNSSWLPWKVPSELHFRQHKHNCHTLLYAAVIMTMQQYQFDVTCKITCIWRHSNSAAGPR